MTFREAVVILPPFIVWLSCFAFFLISRRTQIRLGEITRTIYAGVMVISATIWIGLFSGLKISESLLGVSNEILYIHFTLLVLVSFATSWAMLMIPRKEHMARS